MAVFTTRPKLWLDIEGHGRFQVLSFFSDWARNQIPRAVCTLAIGRRAVSGLKAARIHSEAGNIVGMPRVKVQFKAEGQFSLDDNWPSGEITIFEGRFAGLGLQKNRGVLQIQASLVHWIADLDFTASFNSNSHPTNMTDYTYASVLTAIDGTGLTGGFGLPGTAEGTIIDEWAVTTDLWGEALKPFMVGMANQELPGLREDLLQCLGEDPTKNYQARGALKRMQGETTEGTRGADCSLEAKCYAPPLSMSLGELVPESIATSIANTIKAASLDSFAQNTLWGKLIGEWSPQFLFSVVPLVSTAIVVPFVPGLRSTYCKEIRQHEYVQIDIQGARTRPLRAVAVLGKVAFAAGLMDDAVTGIGGCFAPENADKQGLYRVVGPPSWLEGRSVEAYSPFTTQGLLERNGTASSTTPRPVNADLDGPSGAELVRDMSEMFNGWAHAMYIFETLRGRTGLIAGKLRFDIAPGSTVRVQGVPEKFLRGRDQLGQNIIGDVARVSIAIDAEAPRAGTSFQLLNCRTEAENEDDRTSIAKHPLYTTVFTGAPLVDELWFPGDSCCE